MSAALIADKLRASLLQAAIQGKLTKQLAEDGDARDLLKEIEAEKARLIEEKIIKKEKPLPAITDDEIPFEIPENWVWVKLGNILQLISGQDLTVRDYSDIEIGIPYITGASNFLNGFLTINRWTNNPKSIAAKDDLLLTCKGTIGDMAFLLVEKAHIARQVMAISDKTQKLDLNFIKIVLDNHIKHLKSVAKSMIPGINRDDVLSCLIPLPPLAEQHRIVEAIETALAKLDKLKADETKLYDIQKAFPNKLRASLLQSAIQGQLTEQLPEDGDARDLLKEIEAEKARLIAEKIIKKEKPLPPITDEEIPFEIPENWVWQTLSMVSYTIPSKNYQILSKDILDKGLYPVVSQSQNYIDGYSNTKEKIFTSVPIIIFGDHTKIIKLVDFPFIVGADGTKLIKPLTINIRYLEIVLQFHKINMHDRGYSRHFQFIKDSLIPIPPLEEQQRIVKKLDEILGKVDGLKKIAG